MRRSVTIHMNRSVSIRLGGLARQALAGEGGGERDLLPSQAVWAIRCYLNDRDAGGPGWPYPSFLEDIERGGDEVEIELSIDGGLWQALEEEAVRQDVSAEQLAEHAALYFAAEVNAGRITRRILKRFDDLS